MKEIERLYKIIKRKQEEGPAWIKDLKEFIVKELKPCPNIVFAYGSRLYSKLSSPTSNYDLFVIYEKPWFSFKTSPLNYLISYILPPTVTFKSFKDEKNTFNTKINYLFYFQAEKETSPSISDLHIAGRFSKRMALVFANSERDRDTAVKLQMNAIWLLTPLCLALLKEEFTTEEFALELLSLSYQAEVRIVERKKVMSLFEQEKAYYLELFDTLLHLFFGFYKWGYRIDKDLWRVNLSLEEKRKLYNWYRLIIYQSRIRSVFRWPKYMITVEDWLDYILKKLERHTGIRLDLPEHVKQYPLIFGWPYFIELIKKGIVKSNIT